MRVYLKFPLAQSELPSFSPLCIKIAFNRRCKVVVIVMDIVVCITLFTNIFSYQCLNLWQYNFRIFFFFFPFDTWIKQCSQHVFSVKPVICSRGYRQLWKYFVTAIARVFLLTCLCFLLISADILKYLVSEPAEGRRRGNATEYLSHWPKRLFLVRRIGCLNSFSLTKKQVVILSSHLA